MVYAIIRQESAFREEVTSAAGAQGLMQIMPSTARLVAHKEKIDLSRSNKNILFNTEKNIQLGVATLKNLAPIFHNHPLLMAAAYNAGPKQVRQWLAQYPHQSMDIWIETLPWRETRDYLKNITAFYTVYNYRLHKPINIENILKPISNSK